LWAVKSGQYQDTYTPSVRMLFDEEEKINKDNTNQSSGKQDTIHSKEKT